MKGSVDLHGRLVIQGGPKNRQFFLAIILVNMDRF